MSGVGPETWQWGKRCWHCWSGDNTLQVTGLLYLLIAKASHISVEKSNYANTKYHLCSWRAHFQGISKIVMQRNIEAECLRKSWRNSIEGAVCGKMNKWMEWGLQYHAAYTRKFRFAITLQEKNMSLNTSKGFSLCMKKTGNHREPKRDTTSDTI